MRERAHAPLRDGLRYPRRSERTGNARGHAVIAVLVDWDVRAVRLDGVADMGREAPVAQGPVLRPHLEPEVPVELPGSEQRILRAVSANADAGRERYRQPAVERSRNGRSQAERATSVVVLPCVDELEGGLPLIDVRPSTICTRRGVRAMRHPSRSVRSSCDRYPALIASPRRVEPESRNRSCAQGPRLRW